MSRCRVIGVLLTLAVLIVAAGQVHAATVYTDKTAWQAALATAGGSVDFTVDFNSFTTDTPFRTSALDLGPFSLEQIAGDTSDGNLVDVAPIGWSLSVNGSPQASIWAFDDRIVDMVFDAPVLGFGGDMQAYNNLSLNVDLNLGTAGTAMWDAPSGATFIGIVSNTPFTTARFSDGGDSTQTWGWDNIQGGSGAVPEPTTLAIWAMFGGLGLIAARRRRVA